MANVTLSVSSGLKTANFSVSVSFGTSVTGFDKTDINLRAFDGNGVTGVDYTLTGTGDTYTLNFTLPTNKQGIFEVSVTGMVTPEGGSNSEAVMGNTVVIVYDTTAQITATFGTPVYRDGGVIEVPLTFAEAVLAPAKTIFEVSHASGDALTDVTAHIVGTGTAWTLIFEIPPDRKGSFNITANGPLLKAATKVWAPVVGSPTTLTVNYDTRVPFIEDYDIPANYEHGKKFDVRIAFNVPVTGLHLNNLVNIFLLEGAYLGTPTPYKWIGTTPPDFETAVPETLPSDWQQLTAAPGGHKGAWHGETGRYFLIRFDKVPSTATGIFTITLKQGTVRGPIG